MPTSPRSLCRAAAKAGFVALAVGATPLVEQERLDAVRRTPRPVGVRQRGCRGPHQNCRRVASSRGRSEGAVTYSAQIAEPALDPVLSGTLGSDFSRDAWHCFWPDTADAAQQGGPRGDTR